MPKFFSAALSICALPLLLTGCAVHPHSITLLQGSPPQLSKDKERAKAIIDAGLELQRLDAELEKEKRSHADLSNAERTARGKLAEGMLSAYFGEVRDPEFPDLVVFYSSTGTAPSMVLVQRGFGRQVLYNEQQMWALVFSTASFKSPKEKGPNDERTPPASTERPAGTALDPLHVKAVKDADTSDLTVRLEGLYTEPATLPSSAVELLSQGGSLGKRVAIAREKDEDGSLELEKLADGLFLASTRLELRTDSTDWIIINPKNDAYRSGFFMLSNVTSRLFGASVGVGVSSTHARAEADAWRKAADSSFFVLLNLYPANRAARLHSGGWWETLRWSGPAFGIAVNPDIEDVFAGADGPRAMGGIRFAFPSSPHSTNPWSHFGLTTGVAFRRAGEKTPVAILDYRY